MQIGTSAIAAVLLAIGLGGSELAGQRSSDAVVAAGTAGTPHNQDPVFKGDTKAAFDDLAGQLEAGFLLVMPADMNERFIDTRGLKQAGRWPNDKAPVMSQPRARRLSSRRMNSARRLERPCGGARNSRDGRSHEETESIPARLERRASTTGPRSLRNAIRHRGGG